MKKMGIVDFRSASNYDSSEPDVTYLVLASNGTLFYRIGQGNIYDWNSLSSGLFDWIDSNGSQISLEDIGLDPFKTVILNPRVVENNFESWFCEQILAREIVPSSAPVVVLYEDGFQEHLGTVASVSEKKELAFSF